DREDREARLAPQHAHAEAEVLDELRKPDASPHIARDLRDERDVAELASGVATGFLGRLPRGGALALGHAQVRRDLVVQLLVPAAAEPGVETGQLHELGSSRRVVSATM